MLTQALLHLLPQVAFVVDNVSQFLLDYLHVLWQLGNRCTPLGAASHGLFNK